VVFYAISPGEYKLMVPPGLSARTFLGESELTGAFTVSADTPPIRAALKKVSGTIRGTVEKGEGATVVLVPQWISDVTFGQTAVSGSDGTFELNEVTPGDYFIAAFDHMDGMSPSAAVLSLMRIRGTALHVEEDLAANINLSMVSLPR
jgi:hypothetical protein